MVDGEPRRVRSHRCEVPFLDRWKESRVAAQPGESCYRIVSLARLLERDDVTNIGLRHHVGPDANRDPLRLGDIDGQKAPVLGSGTLWRAEVFAYNKASSSLRQVNSSLAQPPANSLKSRPVGWKG